jgi:hypothetical protein
VSSSIRKFLTQETPTPFFSEFADRPKSAQNFPQRSVGL